MVTEPRSLTVTATAQEAGEILVRPEVRAVYVVDGEGRLAGVITRKTLVSRVVAGGLDPRSTAVSQIAERPNYTIDPDASLDEAFRFLEDEDAERVPVVGDGGRLLGVLSRSVLQRRLAEDEEPAEPEP
jgi:CBS domain-containing protein